MIEHLKRGTKLEMIEEDCELRLLRGDIQHIGLFNTEAEPLIVRDSSTVMNPKKGRQTILDELHSTHSVQCGLHEGNVPGPLLLAKYPGRFEEDIQPVSGLQKRECLKANQVVQQEPSKLGDDGT